MGSLVTIENLNDPHAQKFLRGHDMNVSFCKVFVVSKVKFTYIRSMDRFVVLQSLTVVDI